MTHKGEAVVGEDHLLLNAEVPKVVAFGREVGDGLGAHRALPLVDVDAHLAAHAVDADHVPLRPLGSLGRKGKGKRANGLAPGGRAPGGDVVEDDEGKKEEEESEREESAHGVRVRCGAWSEVCVDV